MILDHDNIFTIPNTSSIVYGQISADQQIYNCNSVTVSQGKVSHQLCVDVRSQSVIIRHPLIKLLVNTYRHRSMCLLQVIFLAVTTSGVIMVDLEADTGGSCTDLWSGNRPRSREIICLVASVCPSVHRPCQLNKQQTEPAYFTLY